MQSAEIELKVPVADPMTFQERLPQLGFSLKTPRTFEHNTLYDTADRDLRSRHQILRLRKYGDVCTLTHKRTPENADDTLYKTRIETETLVSDCDAMTEVFRQLGYTPAFVYEKFRTEWSCPLANSSAIAHLVVDETPIGVWAELEGSQEWIDETLERLEINRRSCLTDSYGTLFTKWKRSTGSSAEHLTFDAIPVLVSTP